MSDHTRRPQRRTPKALQVVAAIGFTIAGVLLYCMSINMFGNSPLNLALTWVGVSVLSVFAGPQRFGVSTWRPASGPAS